MLIGPFKHLRTKLLFSTLAVVLLLTTSVLVLVQARMRKQVRTDLTSTLRTESRVYAEIERAHREQSLQSAQLIANQPSLKALMSTNDRPTVEDGSQSILPTSKSDLLILQNSSGHILALHANSPDASEALMKPMLEGTGEQEDWWLVGGHLYNVNLVPIVAGEGAEERGLGRMVLGYEIKPETILRTGDFGNSTFLFERQGHVLVSSVPATTWPELEAQLPQDGASQKHDFVVGGERYLADYIELPGDHPVRLYCLQSYDQATSFLRELNQKLIILGVVAVLVGAILAFAISRQITRPLEQLVIGAQQLQDGNFEFQIPVRGNDEVAHLGRAFEQMRVNLKNSRESMLRAARMEAVGRMAGGIAHDFNNLVMIIRGYSNMLLESVPAESRPLLGEIKRAGDRASSLTRQLLAFSRKQILEPQILDPNQTMRNMVKMLRVLIGADIELVTSLSDEIGQVLVDPGQLEQVIMNLAVNARDAMPTGGKLIVESQPAHLDEKYAAANAEAQAGDYVLIAVSDNGSGMSKETLTQIFEPFFTTKEPGKGTGLGLATVYGIVKQSGGHISVYSEPGIGTTFKVYLPAQAGTVPQEAPHAERTAKRGVGTVLLVEDEPALRFLAAAELKKLGYTVLEAENGIKALIIPEVRAGKVDIVIADVVMPLMGGPALIDDLRAKGGNFVAILMTGYTEASVLDRLTLGSDTALLQKPFSVETLAAKIEELQQKESAVSVKAAASGV